MKCLDYPCKLNTPTAVALGCFDGVHLGHKAVVSGAVSCKAQGLVPCVFTFSDNPGKPHLGVLNTIEEKSAELESVGTEIMVSSAFEEVRDMTAEEFVREVLCGALMAKAVFCGYNYRFGRGAEADADALKRLCESYGISVTCVDEVVVDGNTVSSTAIRNLLEKGAAEQANAMLGSPYCMSGRVIHGNGIGRTLSTPTLNIDVPSEKLLPAFGVYVAEVFVGDVSYPSVCNIGLKPTVGSQKPTVEAYLLDAKGDFYSDYVTLNLLSFIRSERCFDSLDALRTQILSDVSMAEEYFDNK